MSMTGDPLRKRVFQSGLPDKNSNRNNPFHLKTNWDLKSKTIDLMYNLHFRGHLWSS